MSNQSLDDRTKIPNEYTNANGDTLEIGEDSRGFWVRCWNEDETLHWEVRGVVIAGDATRETRRPFTREEALKEFNNWR